MQNSHSWIDTVIEDLFKTYTTPPANNPPYAYWLNETDGRVHLEIAVPGFDKSDLQVWTESDVLAVVAKKPIAKSPPYKHNTIARRNFDFRLPLSPYLKIKEVELENGILYIDLVKIGADPTSRYIHEIK